MRRRNPKKLSPAPLGKAPEAASPAWYARTWLDCLFILAISLAAYWPALCGGFLVDDDGFTTDPVIRQLHASLHGLWRIWFDVHATPQYYPVLNTAFWLQAHLWGDAVLGYHLTNVALHAGAACLLVLIVRRLEVPGAWLAGLIFAVHPVCVESVAWIAEQKNTLSGVFYLASAFVYLGFDKTRRGTHYAWALALFVLAVFSKSPAATLPAALLVVFWWQRGIPGLRRNVLPLLPWFVVGVGASLFTSWVSIKGNATTSWAVSEIANITLVQRLLIASRSLWFYAGQITLPANLMFEYPRWTVNPAIWWQWLFPIGVLAVGIGFWIIGRRRRGPLAAFILFGVALFPTFGIYQLIKYSFVADHFQYLAVFAMIVPLAWVLTVTCGRISPSRAVTIGVPALIVMALFTLTWRGTCRFADTETLSRRTLESNPDGALSHLALAWFLMNSGGQQKLDEAITHFSAAIRLTPYDDVALKVDLAAALQMSGRTQESIPILQTVIRRHPNLFFARINLGTSLYMLGRFREAADAYESAMRDYHPGDAAIHYDCGLAYLKLGRQTEAIKQFDAALRMQPDYPDVHAERGVALAQLGRLPAAVADFQFELLGSPTNPTASRNLPIAMRALSLKTAQNTVPAKPAHRASSDSP